MNQVYKKLKRKPAAVTCYHKFNSPDAVYVQLTRGKVHRTVVCDHGIHIDYDKNEDIVGIEYLNARQVTVQERIR